jgi:hypothetical protein
MTLMNDRLEAERIAASFQQRASRSNFERGFMDDPHPAFAARTDNDFPLWKVPCRVSIQWLVS